MSISEGKIQGHRCVEGEIIVKNYLDFRDYYDVGVFDFCGFERN